MKYGVIVLLIGPSIGLSCKDAVETHGLSEFENLSNVSDFMPELWVPDNTYKGSLSDDFKTFYFFRKANQEDEKYIPYISYFDKGKWKEPVIPDYFDKNLSYTYQLKMPDTQELVFLSNKRVKTDTAQHPNYNFWTTTISSGQFSEPLEISHPKLIYNYNSQPCISADGTIYFTSDSPDWSRTYSYKLEAGKQGYAAPEIFQPVNNWRTNKDWVVYEFCISPEEDFVIVSIQDKTYKTSSPDLYISHLKDGDWSQPEKLSDDINTPGVENFPVITRDGNYLIFTRDFSQFKIISVKRL